LQKREHIASAKQFVITLCTVWLVKKSDNVARHQIDENLAASVFQEISEVLHWNIRRRVFESMTSVAV
jgi:hypothetical protein